MCVWHVCVQVNKRRQEESNSLKVGMYLIWLFRRWAFLEDKGVADQLGSSAGTYRLRILDEIGIKQLFSQFWEAAVYFPPHRKREAEQQCGQMRQFWHGCANFEAAKPPKKEVSRASCFFRCFFVLLLSRQAHKDDKDDAAYRLFWRFLPSLFWCIQAIV